MRTGDLPKLLKWWSYVDVWPFHGKVKLLPHAFVWAICIYIGSIEVTCRATVAKIILIRNLRWPPSCLCLFYFPATVLFTCIKWWFFRNHLANFRQISQWSYCWNVIDSLFKWSRSIDCKAHIFFFKTKNCSNDDLFISCDDRIGKMLHNICISAVAMSLRWASRGPWVSCFYFRAVNLNLILPMKFLIVGLSVQEKGFKIAFQEGNHGGHLGFSVGSRLLKQIVGASRQTLTDHNSSPWAQCLGNELMKSSLAFFPQYTWSL